MIERRRFLFLRSVVGSYRFCSLRHASNGFFCELATMSFASYLVRATSAVCICCRTNSRFCTPRSWFVAVGWNSRLMSPLEISVVCSAAHSNIISDSLITPGKNASVFFDHCWTSSSLPKNSFGRPMPFTSMRLGVSFRTWAVASCWLPLRVRILQPLELEDWVPLVEVTWALSANSSCWSCVTTCSIVVDIAPPQAQVPQVLLLRVATQLQHLQCREGRAFQGRAVQGQTEMNRQTNNPSPWIEHPPMKPTPTNTYTGHTHTDFFHQHRKKWPKSSIAWPWPKKWPQSNLAKVEPGLSGIGRRWM